MTTCTPAPLYTLHDADPIRDQDIVLSIWRGNLQHEHGGHEAKYRWFYLSGPDGPPLLQLMRHEPSGDWVGTCAAGRRRMLLNGNEIRGGVIVDFAVLPEHRSLGPALILQGGLIAASAHQLDLLYGFPNPKAVAAVKRGGYEKLTDIVGYARVLRHARFLAEHMPAVLANTLGAILDMAVWAWDGLRRLVSPRVHTEWSDQADARMDTLWQQSDRTSGLMMVRDAAYARWRFDEAPQGRTRYLFVMDKRDGAPLAWFATRSDAGLLRVRDFWSSEGVRGVSRTCVEALLWAARATGHVGITTEITAPAASLAGWRACGFFERERRPVYGRWGGSTAHSAGMGWYLTSADKDG
ncbi:hypothetical protein [Lysobacter olei]